MIDLVFVFFGLFAAFVIDILWWVKPKFQKSEKGLEAHEHYHIGIILFIAAVLVNLIYQPATWFLVGMGFVFIVGEWRQSIEVAGKKVIPGKPFALGSKHFKGSSAIGIGLLGILLIISVVLSVEWLFTQCIRTFE